jgi:hypothetical protein
MDFIASSRHSAGVNERMHGPSTSNERISLELKLKLEIHQGLIDIG